MLKSLAESSGTRENEKEGDGKEVAGEEAGILVLETVPTLIPSRKEKEGGEGEKIRKKRSYRVKDKKDGERGEMRKKEKKAKEHEEGEGKKLKKRKVPKAQTRKRKTILADLKDDLDLGLDLKKGPEREDNEEDQGEEEVERPFKKFRARSGTRARKQVQLVMEEVKLGEGDERDGGGSSDGSEFLFDSRELEGGEEDDEEE